MPKILITGNGFDLNLGLPTSYGDFIKILSSLSEGGDVDFESIYSKSLKSELIFETYNEFNFDHEKIDDLKVEIETNLWFQFFKNEFEIETWIDFENKIEYVLNILLSSTKYFKDNIFSKGSLPLLGTRHSIELFNNDREIVQVLNEFNIISLFGNNDVILNTEYLVKKYDYFIDVDINKITKKLIEELENFKLIFNYYFEVFVYPFYDNKKTKIDTNLFTTIDKHYTFNYTPTFEFFYSGSIKTNFLHGKIDSTSNKIVLGINEIPNNKLDKKYFLPFTKYFQKLNNNTDYKFITEYKKKTSSNYIFFFFGHSLDTSDKDYINEVFNFINLLKSKTKKIVIIHHDEKSKSQLLINLLDIRGKNNIDSLMRNEILVFYQVDSIELINELERDVTRSYGV